MSSKAMVSEITFLTASFLKSIPFWSLQKSIRFTRDFSGSSQDDFLTPSTTRSEATKSLSIEFWIAVGSQSGSSPSFQFLNLSYGSSFGCCPAWRAMQPVLATDRQSSGHPCQAGCALREPFLKRDFAVLIARGAECRRRLVHFPAFKE